MRSCWPSCPCRPSRSRPSWSRASKTDQARIDELIAAHAIDWTLDRMPVVDRAVLRMATFELLARPDVPTGVVISEAVELAKQYSTDESGRFVNGVLATIARESSGRRRKRSGAVAAAGPLGCRPRP